MKKIYILTEKKLNELIQLKTQEIQKKLNVELQQRIIEKEASLSSLQSQINPHFLYNALEGIRGQAILDEAPVIEEISQALANYFRYSISSKSDIATLSEELMNVKNYLSIQQFRFHNRFAVDIVYDHEDYEMLETVLPKMTLQPIVENAVAHGFERTKKEAVIRIQIVFTQKSVNITISDNGAGMDTETLKELNERIQNFDMLGESEGRHNGIAMPNVNRRIQLMFGDEYGLYISSIEGIGTDVEIHMPYCTKAALHKGLVDGEGTDLRKNENRDLKNPKPEYEKKFWV